MKIILTCGHPYSGHQAVAELLQHCGVADALPSRNNQYSPAALQSKIFEVYEWNAENSTHPLTEPGKIWQELGGDLFMGNLSQPLWGWSDHQTVWLMDFWKAFDPQIRFLLVYSAPEFLVCNMLQQQVDAPEDMDVILNGWHRYNTELLRFYNRNRDRCLLVNAQTALQQPSVLLEKMADAFALKLQLPTEEARQNTSRVAAGLACSLISNTSPTDQNALYQELESAADIISSGVKPSTQERLQAWSEYNRLILELHNNASLTEQQQQELTTLKAQQAELEQQTHNNLNKQQELEQENELLLLQLHQVQEELEQHFLNNQELGEKEKQLSIDIQSKQQEIDNLKTNTSQLNASIQAKQELEQENELLLLQLHQVQEELEHYFLEYQKVSTIPVKSGYDLLGISLDPRKETFTGENWYYAEHDGRWAGPANSSTINIPPLAQDKDYEIVLDVIGSMAKEITNGMKASINGKPLDIQHPKPRSVWQRFKKEKYSYPRKLRMHFNSQGMESSQPWVLKLDFPKVVSPSECGGDAQDKRKLAIRLHKLTLTQL